jgi:predicted nucleic acid-binding protein
VLPFFDTNVVVYAFTPSGAFTQKAESLLLGGGVVSVQVLNEASAVGLSKFKMSWAQVRQLVDDVLLFCPNAQPLTEQTHREAMRISERYGYSLWDDLILASALEAGCTTLYSEDMQHGQIIDGLRIENPFHATSTP